MNSEQCRGPALSLTNISKVYRNREGKAALSGVSLELREGECLAIVGRNGAGKSTLLKIISGLLTPSSGQINCRIRSSYLPELNGIYPYLTARESLEYFSSLNKKNIDIDNLLEMLKLPEDKKKFVMNFSKGMKRKTSFGMMLASDSDLFIMDEPFEGLDPEICLDLVEMINSLKKNLKTFIIASHNISYVESISDQVILLDDGKIKDFIKMNGSRRYNIFFTSDLASCREVMERMNLIYDDINFPRVMVEFQGKVDDMLATLVMNGLRFNEVKRESLSETLLQLIR